MIMSALHDDKKISTASQSAVDARRKQCAREQSEGQVRTKKRPKGTKE
jgi:hypothetical protein